MINDFTVTQGRVHLIGDPHLGKKFEVGVPIHRRGEREKSQLQHFKDELAYDADIIVMVGDLFDHPYVGYQVVQDASDAIREAAATRPNVKFYIMAGNHDLPRNITNVGAFDDLEDRISDRLANLFVVRSPTVGSGLAMFPWEWDVRADLQVKDVANEKAEAAVGHWDLSTFDGKDNHLVPVAQLREAFGDIPLYSGHYHTPGTYGEVLCVGSLEPYTHAEDASGDLYVTLSLGEALERDDLHDKNVRIRLAPGEEQPNIDAMSLTFIRTKVADEGATDQRLSLDTMDWNGILAKKLASLDERVRVFIEERLGGGSEE